MPRSVIGLRLVAGVAEGKVKAAYKKKTYAGLSPAGRKYVRRKRAGYAIKRKAPAKKRKTAAKKSKAKYTPLKKKVLYKGRKRTVYKGPRGGHVVKVDGKYRRVKK